MVKSLVARVFVFFLFLLAVSCGSSVPRVATPELTSWEREMLGGPPDAHLILRMDKARADPVYGGAPTAYDKPSKPLDPEVEAAINATQAIELWMVAEHDNEKDHSFLAVVRGRMPLGVLKHEEAGRKVLMTEPERLPSGVRLYPFSDQRVNGIFLVLPSGTWVAATGRVTNRVRYHFHSQSADPPAALHEPEAIVALWIGPHATKLSSSTRDTTGLQGGGLVVRGSSRGDMDVLLTFKDEKSAENALSKVQALLALVPDFKRRLVDQCPAWEGVTIEMHQDGKSIAGRMANLPPLIRAYRSGACRYEKDRDQARDRDQ